MQITFPRDAKIAATRRARDQRSGVDGEWKLAAAKGLELVTAVTNAIGFGNLTLPAREGVL
jgi:hypothetical protein